MGLKYGVVPSTREELLEVSCDKCGIVEEARPGQWNECGEPYSRYHSATVEKEFVVISKNWGYYSKKDRERHTIVLCESCYDILFNNVGKTIKESYE